MWTIRPSQMDAFADDTLQRVVERIARNVSVTYPEVRLTLGAEAYAAWVRELVEAAMALDLTLEDNLLRFVEWHALVGVTTSVAEVYPWAFDMLRAPDEHEDDRVAAVDLRMQGLDEEEG
jgi:hypothetical protein